MEEKEMDYSKTKNKVMRLVKQYDKSLTKVGTKGRPKLTSNYNFEEPVFTKNGASTTEKSAIYNVDGFQKDIEFIDNIHRVLNNLDDEEKFIVWHNCFEIKSHVWLSNKLNISTANLSLRKIKSLEKFAYALDILVYK